MKVRINGTEYEVDRNCNWIELILDETDKANIAQMPEGFKHYFCIGSNPEAEAEVDKRISTIKEEKGNGDMFIMLETERVEDESKNN